MDILIVEDDTALLAQLKETLEGLALATASARTAELGLTLIESDQHPIILLTDINLGDGMNGLDLASLLAQRRPALVTIFISGETHWMQQRPLNIRERFIRKPFRSAHLFNAIRELEGLLGREQLAVVDGSSAYALV